MSSSELSPSPGNGEGPVSLAAVSDGQPRSLFDSQEARCPLNLTESLWIDSEARAQENASEELLPDKNEQSA